jgi:SAM-dependent methyltransferase
MKNVKNWIRAFGVNPRIALAAPRGLKRYFSDRAAFKRATSKLTNAIPMRSDHPVLHEYADTAGHVSGHYFHMDLWAARKIYERAPKHHVDIGSRIDGFIAHLLTFRDVEVIDIRPLKSSVSGLTFIEADATTLANYSDGSLHSVSCLHAAEHFGLGRYGDPIDPMAYLKLIRAIGRVLAPGGRLYFAVPIGEERVEFNAHRVFNPLRILNDFSCLELASFSAVNDQGDFIAEAKPDHYQVAHMACGLYEFTKSVN